MNKISAFAQSETGLMTAGIVAVFVLISSAVSLNVNKTHASEGLTTPGAPDIVHAGGSGGAYCNTSGPVRMANRDRVFPAAPRLHLQSAYIVSELLPLWGGRADTASLAKCGPNVFELLEPITPPIPPWAGL